jgi:hypothetical protein
MSLLWFNGGIISLKITQEVYDKVEAYVNELNEKNASTGKDYCYYEKYWTIFHNEKEHSLDHPWVTIFFGHDSLNTDTIAELRAMFPEAVIYVSGSDGDVNVSIMEKTYEEYDKEQMEYNIGRKQKGRPHNNAKRFLSRY